MVRARHGVARRHAVCRIFPRACRLVLVVVVMLNDDVYGRWKSLVPFLYDWFAHTPTSWPSLCVRWGDVVESNEYKTKQRLFLTEQVDDATTSSGRTVPNTIVVCQAEILKPRVAPAEAMVFDEFAKSPVLKKERTLAHPGEVNRMRCVPGREHVLVTHTDAPELFVYDTSAAGMGKAAQVKRGDGSSYTAPACALRGHTENAEYALAISACGTRIASGGKDSSVLVWDMSDVESAAVGERRKGGDASTSAAAVVGGGLSKAELETHPNVWSRLEFKGHTDTIEDVVFNPHSAHELCSVGDDRNMLFWDARTNKEAGAAKLAHSDDIHAVGWSVHDAHVLVTGSKDTTVKVWDRRTLSDSSVRPMYEFDTHIDSVLCVDMNPAARGVFMTADEVGRINVFDYTKVGAEQTAEQSIAGPPQLIFQHCGHRGTVWDIAWNPYDPWTVASTSVGDEQNTLQLWRINDLIYRPEEECLEELMQHRDVICPRSKKDKSKKQRKEADGAADEDMVREDTPTENEEK